MELCKDSYWNGLFSNKWEYGSNFVASEHGTLKIRSKLPVTLDSWNRSYENRSKAAFEQGLSSSLHHASNYSRKRTVFDKAAELLCFALSVCHFLGTYSFFHHRTVREIMCSRLPHSRLGSDQIRQCSFGWRGFPEVNGISSTFLFLKSKEASSSSLLTFPLRHSTVHSVPSAFLLFSSSISLS